MKNLSKIIVAACIFVASSANASLILSISDGVNTEKATDTNNDGIVSYSSEFDANPTLSWLFSSGTGFGNTLIGSLSADAIHLDAAAVSSAAGGTLTVMLTETGFTRDPARLAAGFGGVTSGNVRFKTYVDTTNTEFGLQTLLSDSGDISGGPFSGSDWEQINFGDNQYSMTLVATITHEGSTRTSFDYDITIPEPASVALLGAGFIAMGFVGRRSRKRNQQTKAS